MHEKMATALASFEESLPRSELVIMIHLAGHIANQVKEYGPIRSHWMFGFEGYIHVLKEGAKNRAQVIISSVKGCKECKNNFDTTPHEHPLFCLRNPSQGR